MMMRNLSSLLMVLLTQRSSSFASLSPSSASSTFLVATNTVLNAKKAPWTSSSWFMMLKSSSSSTVSTGYDTASSSSHKIWRLSALRGGGNEDMMGGYTSTMRYSTSTSSSSSSSSSSSTENEQDMDIVTKMVQESMGIVGSNMIPSTLGVDDDGSRSVSYSNTASLSEFRVLFVLGGPGAGKGTQCERMTQYYPCVHLSVGELLRAEQDRIDSPHRTLIQNCLITGTIVPVDISLALLQRAMEETRATRGESLLYLVDGFPRNYDNLEGWNRCMTTPAITSVWGVLMFTCPLHVLEQRILARGETSGRSDDNLSSVQKRFRTFRDQTEPVVDVLRMVQDALLLQQQQQQLSTEDTTTTARISRDNKNSILQVVDIQGDKTVDQVWANVQSVMEGFLANDVWTANAKLVQAAETQNQDLYRQVCVYLGDEEDMVTYEGSAVEGPLELRNPSIRFMTGTKAITSYDRVLDGQTVLEERVWSHEGSRGWVNIHFTRTPK